MVSANERYLQGEVSTNKTCLHAGEVRLNYPIIHFPFDWELHQGDKLFFPHFDNDDIPLEIIFTKLQREEKEGILVIR
jgi:hypothetical protein